MIYVCIPLILTVLLLPVRAHVGDRLFPVYEFPTSLLPDVHDASLDDWEAVVPGPSMDVFDFFSDPDVGKGDPIDLDDLDYQIFLGWHGPTGHLYFAMERLDDVYVNEYGGGATNVMWRHDGMEFMVDGDHSGGPYANFSQDEAHLTGAQAQQFIALPESPDGRSIGPWLGPDGSFEHDWISQPPMADAGGAVLDGHPAQSLFEFYLTPFDKLIASDQEHSTASRLAAGRIIGINIAIPDFDSAPGEYDGFFTLAGVPDTWRDASLFVDAELIGCDLADCGLSPETASVVRPDSWGRIKASLVP